MSLKTKTTPPPLEGAQQSKARFVPEERFTKINPELDQRLNEFIKANPAMHEYYSTMVSENPERAVRALVMNKMFKHEAVMRQTERQAPQAKEWLEQQDPSVKVSIMDRIKKLNPFYQEKALVNEIAREKARIDFAPPRQSPRIST
jgi:hypothetical protein